MRGTEGRELEGEIWVWNRILKRPLRIADMAIWDADVVAKRSLGATFSGIILLCSCCTRTAYWADGTILYKLQANLTTS